MEQNPAELLKSILNTAEKHPNAKVSKLIKCFEQEKTPQNIALLLIELAEHPEFSADISISLKYYLDCFNKLRDEPSFAEAGIVLFNSSKIYAKRVDHIHNEIERVILSLSNVENTEEQNNPNTEATQNTSKAKRCRKRALEQINGAVEANMNPKRFKKLLHNKRFESVTQKHNNFLKPLSQDSDKSMKNYTPQSTWQHSAIEDFDYEDEIDSKKNYKLFTYHLEHRYNTLIPDINFKMYFKIKDFINGDCNVPESWPPLSDAYIEQFLDLEDAILLREGHLGKTREKIDASRLKEACTDKSIASNGNNSQASMESGIQLDLHSTGPLTDSLTQQNTSQNESTQLMDSHMSVCESFSSAKSRDSGIGSEISQIDDQTQTTVANESQSVGLDNSNNLTLDSTQPSIVAETSAQSQGPGETTLEILTVNKIIDNTDASHLPETKCGTDSTETNEKDTTLLDLPKPLEEDLSTLKVILPHLPDEGVCFADLDEKDRRMLSPAVVTQDVFGCLRDKSNIVIKIDDAIETLFKVKEPSEEFLTLPLFERPHFSIRFNILKIPLKFLNKHRRFKLGKDFDLLKKDRLRKYLKRSTIINFLMDAKCVHKVKESNQPEHISPPSSPSYEPDWLGFPEESLTDKSRTLSRDSGISLHPTEKENIEDFAETSDLLSSTIIPTSKEDSSQLAQNVALIETVQENLPLCTEQTADITKAPDPPSSPPTNVEIAKCSDNLNSENISMEDKTSTQLEELTDENRVRKKVHEWHSHLQPILACSRERHHFDVFALGTEIMTQFDKPDLPSDKVSFQNVMEQKDESLISRYFLSMLLLANQGNILIDVQNKNTNQPSELHDIRLKLLSRKRNIVSLEDNIGLRTPSTSSTHIEQQSVNAVVRTLKSVSEVPKTDDCDSGVAMSETSMA